MHFRERGQIVQLIRSREKGAKGEGDTKKGKREVVGRLVKAKPELSDELKAALTPEERKEVAAWVAGYAAMAQLKRELAARSLPEQLALAKEWFADQKGNDARFLAASLVPAWTRLRASLKKGGLVE